jgi:hypothetical protein
VVLVGLIRFTAGSRSLWVLLGRVLGLLALLLRFFFLLILVCLAYITEKFFGFCVEDRLLPNWWVSEVSWAFNLLPHAIAKGNNGFGVLICLFCC